MNIQKGLIIKKCPNCNKTFKTFSGKKIYCSYECFKNQWVRLPQIKTKSKISKAIKVQERKVWLEAQREKDKKNLWNQYKRDLRRAKGLKKPGRKRIYTSEELKIKSNNRSKNYYKIHRDLILLKHKKQKTQAKHTITKQVMTEQTNT